MAPLILPLSGVSTEGASTSLTLIHDVPSPLTTNFIACRWEVGRSVEGLPSGSNWYPALSPKSVKVSSYCAIFLSFSWLLRNCNGRWSCQTRQTLPGQMEKAMKNSKVATPIQTEPGYRVHSTRHEKTRRGLLVLLSLTGSGKEYCVHCSVRGSYDEEHFKWHVKTDSQNHYTKLLSKGVREHNSRNKTDVIRVIVKSLGADMRMTLATSAGIWPVIIDARVHPEVQPPEGENPIIFPSFILPTSLVNSRILSYETQIGSQTLHICTAYLRAWVTRLATWDNRLQMSGCSTILGTNTDVSIMV